MKHVKEIEEILCNKGKTFYIGGDLQGLIFSIEDFQQLLHLVGENIEND